MFKKACFVMILVLILTSVYSVRLVEPISKELVGDSFVGSIVPGQELELIVSKELGKYNTLTIDSTLPNTINISVKDYLESIKIFIKTSEETLQINYPLKFTLVGDENVSVETHFIVDDALLDSSVLNFSSDSFVNSPAEYEFLLVNKSHADAKFVIGTDLPKYWLGNEAEKVVIVPKLSTKKDSIKVYPQIQGSHFFQSVVIMQNKNLEKEFTLVVNSKPTLLSKFSSSVNGLPFYSISLLPSYILNAIFSFTFN